MIVMVDPDVRTTSVAAAVTDMDLAIIVSSQTLVEVHPEDVDMAQIATIAEIVEEGQEEDTVRLVIFLF